MQREKRDLYDKFGNLTGHTYYKGEVVPKGLYPMVVMIALQNSQGEFLMQKRVERKGGDWGVTGGHPKSGESCEEGIITEVREELGIDISNDDFIEFDSGCDGKECYKMYYLKKDIDLTDIDIQEDELTEVQWFSIEKLNSMVKTKELNQDQIDFFLKAMKFLDQRNKTI